MHATKATQLFQKYYRLCSSNYVTILNLAVRRKITIPEPRIVVLSIKSTRCYADQEAKGLLKAELTREERERERDLVPGEFRELCAYVCVILTNRRTWPIRSRHGWPRNTDRGNLTTDINRSSRLSGH